MSLAQIPQECLRHVLSYLDLPDQHSLLLTCRALFDNTVPTLYRSPFRAILAYNGWLSRQRLPLQEPESKQQQRQQQTQAPPQRVVTFTYVRTHNPHPDPHPHNHISTDYAHTVQTKNMLSSSSVSTSSTASLTSSCSDRTSATTTGSIATTIGATAKKHLHRHRSSLSKSQGRPPPVVHPTLHRSVSSSAYPGGHNSYSSTATSSSVVSHHYNSAITPSTASWTNVSSANTPVINVAIEQLKLSRMARLLQLLIACVDKLQTRLPALRYPGYGQHWVRPPCKVDYLQYFVDHRGIHIVIQCFALLFADLIRCPNTDADGQPIYPFPPPDNEAYKVLYQIQKAFITRAGAQIETLSLSAPNTVEHATKSVANLSKVTRLELRDLDQDFRVDMILDFIQSHRLLFGPILKGITLAESKGVLPGSETNATTKAPLSLTSPFVITANSGTVTTAAVAISAGNGGGNSNISGSKSTPNMVVSNAMPTPFAAYTRPLAMHDHILSILDAIKDLEQFDATAWPSCILYVNRLPLARLQSLWLSFHFPASESADSPAARLAESLERCRQLQQLRVPIRRADVFRWAALEKKTAQICAPILAGPRTKRLPNMRRIHLQGPTLDLVDCVQDAAFAFQDTLEDLEVHSRLKIWQPTTLDFQWTMRRLTRLKLVGEISLHFSLDSLADCPAIVELWLSIFSSSSPSSQLMAASAAMDSSCTFPSTTSPLATMFSQGPLGGSSSEGNNSGQSSGQGSAASSLRFQDPGSNLLFYIRSREMHQIAKLRRLRLLHLSGDWHIPDHALRQIADCCTRLQELTLLETVGTTIGGILLAVEQMKAMERLELRLDVVDLALVRVVTKKLERLEWLHLTSLRVEGQ
ncbi:hypothetical protein EMPS_03703 [Entomortierella parvispora]|uniref:F-box domain-containing protein n=1 Tax=Entomortierella parvispora TaxID=205924 RepID=A0A9P3H7R6_9FUNG|nr:hypothetical protein EMPS_03703 [Entomortierella parvispora]